MATARRKIRFLSCVVCDDIRKEISNKYSLIGVYSNDILVGEFPTKFHLSFWLEFLTDDKKEFDISLRFVRQNAEGKGRKKQFAQMEGTVEANQPINIISLPTPKIPIQFEEPGRLIVEYRLPSGRWKEVKQIEIKERPKEKPKKQKPKKK